MDVKNTLQAIGLTERETNVYLAALELGSTTVQELSRQSLEKRSTVYETIEKLKQQKLMSETRKGKKRLFSAARPSELRFKLKERERMLDEVLPFLNSITKNSSNKPKVRVFEGVSEINTAYQDTLNGRVSEILTIASTDSIMERFGWDWVDNYVNERVRKNIRVRFMTIDSKVAHKVAQMDKHVLRQTRLLPKSKKLTTDIEIYGDKVLFLSFKQKPVGFLIESAAIANSLKIMFEIMWDSIE